MGRDDPGAMPFRGLREFLGASSVRFELDIDIGEALGGDVSHQVVPIRHRGPSSLTRRAQCSDRPGTDGGGETPDDAGIE